MKKVSQVRAVSQDLRVIREIREIKAKQVSPEVKVKKVSLVLAVSPEVKVMLDLLVR